MRTTAGSWLIAALAAALLIPVQAQAQTQVPPDAVALVGAQPVTRSAFDHWFRVAAMAEHARRRRYGACPAKDRDCRIAQRSLRDSSMQFLISATWIEGESALQGISVTDAEVDAEFATDRRASFPRPKDFGRFLRESGMTLEDLRYRVRVTLLSDRLRERIDAGVAPVTDDEVAAYYAGHRSRFRLPQRRDIRFVHTRFAWRAHRAAELLHQGMSWTRVARLLSADRRSRQRVARGGDDRVLDRAIFHAHVHRIAGPVHVKSGYYLFEVTRVHPARGLALAEATRAIRALLASRREQAALDDFVRDFQQRWRSVTICRSGFITPDCANR
ncbi:MAG: hypothetical protein E6G41_06420 [Actinobacteria bacterium]|nr:MAG: hypothetical protein E6G41_06420 [Actinomycetota bacterium]